MTIEQKVFQRADIDQDKLAAYGFVKIENQWTFSQTFMNEDFKAVVRVDEQGAVTGDVYDVSSNEIYIPLRVESMSAGFVGQVRAEYAKILENIKAHCCHENYFISPQANRFAQEMYRQYGDKPVFPWDDFSGGVFKNPDNGKWYAIIMHINIQKIDKTKSGEVEVINLKLAPERIGQLSEQNGFYPAYHMNKKNWITVVLNDTVADELLFALTAESHNFTLGKQVKKQSRVRTLTRSIPKVQQDDRSHKH